MQCPSTLLYQLRPSTWLYLQCPLNWLYLQCPINWLYLQGPSTLMNLQCHSTWLYQQCPSTWLYLQCPSILHPQNSLPIVSWSNSILYLHYPVATVSCCLVSTCPKHLQFYCTVYSTRKLHQKVKCGEMSEEDMEERLGTFGREGSTSFSLLNYDRGIRKRQQVERISSLWSLRWEQVENIASVVQQQCSSLGSEGLVVDFGCGSGNLCLALAAWYRDTTFLLTDRSVVSWDYNTVAICAWYRVTTFLLTDGSFVSWGNNTVATRDDRTWTKIRRNFRFCPVLPGFGFVCPIFARFLPSFVRFRPFFASFCPVFAWKCLFFARFCLVSPSFARFVWFCPNSPGFVRFRSSPVCLVSAITGGNFSSHLNGLVVLVIIQWQYMLAVVQGDNLRTVVSWGNNTGKQPFFLVTDQFCIDVIIQWHYVPCTRTQHSHSMTGMFKYFLHQKYKR